uniref:KIAA1416 protein putative n=1 Tax=Albugo laibachii Nc14 TaxID=890382 RepID=F0W4R0_9STRA|nr:KIAA1416 protein putative [Albugo laibachii Nc14]|eukprot:CCA16095.1 KIAA1416 protein putative [Albugo laibachii Nc14]
MATESVVTRYCVCQQQDSGIMIECIRGTGGCNGWVHPNCCGLVLTQTELEALDSYICPLCEKPDDDYSRLKTFNTQRANEFAFSERRRSTVDTPLSTNTIMSEEKRKKPKRWGCQDCGQYNSVTLETCQDCGGIRGKSAAESSQRRKSAQRRKSLSIVPEMEVDDHLRRSHRGNSGKKKSYVVPGSDDEEILSENEVAMARVSKAQAQARNGSSSGNKRFRNEMDSSSASETESSKEKAIVKRHEALTEHLSSMIIEKIMGCRKASIEMNEAEVVEYYIKWKNFSYLHCSWETTDTLLSLDPQTNKQRIKRFLEKKQFGVKHRVEDEEEEFDVGDPRTGEETEYFDPEYLEIHRIIASRKEASSQDDDGRWYLVKWRILPYSDATWERAVDLKDDKAIEQYEASLHLPPKIEWEPLPRPSLREYRKLEASPSFGIDGSLQLRIYQLEGLNWLLWNWYNERPSILADEMGLGKTIQTLAFLDRLRVDPKIQCRGPFLIVAPLSLIVQWQNECETWTCMNCIVYHGNTEAREVIREYEFYFMNENGKPDKKKPFRFHIIVTTYEVAIKDIAFLSKIRWRCLIVDEAHRLKNQSSRLVEQLRSLRRDHCVLLTGTPLQNKTEELWALLNFLDTRSFPSVEEFLDKFGDLHQARQVADLHKMLKPYLLRRVKEDVEKSLPPKEETIIEVELTPVQKQWYRAIYEKNTSFLSRGGNPNNIPNLMNVMMELRKCCNHPYLNNGVEEILNEGLRTERERHEMMVKCCGKMVLLDKLLPRLKEGGHKVLIFSQMVRVLDIIEDYLRFLGHAYERLDGNIRGNDRQAAVNRFVKEEYKRFVMLLSTKAGGLGLNLTAADTVVIFDSDWNPQNDLQAQARAHRIGQTHSVKIYRLITRKTYEMHMFHKASLKLGLDKAVLTHMRREKEDQKEGISRSNKSKKSKAQETKEIDELLKRGAYDVFRDENDAAAEQFCAADIDQILQRSAQVVQYEQEARSTFSKASFVSATTSDDVDIDDPDFWKKAVGLTEPEPDLSGDLPLQRKRTRVARFGAISASIAYDSELDDEEIEKKEKERKEREKEAEKDRMEEKREPRDWTLNGRDRLQRALMHYGFGRWEMIRSQSGGSRSVEEVERFAREFLYVSGLSCMDSISKDETLFVKSVIRACVYAQENGLIRDEDVPSVLRDEDFTARLKQGGGRRVLIRLDMLMRLHRIIADACDSMDTLWYASHKERDEKDPKPPSPATDLDFRVAFYGAVNVVKHIRVLDVGDRPVWTQITSWWNNVGDRSLLMGVFLHGYGRCTQIIGDSRLCFYQMERGLKEEKSVDKVEAVEETSVGTDDEDLVEMKDDGAFKQPEVQQMNRLLLWLLSAEDIKRQKEVESHRRERVSIDQQRVSALEKKQRAAALYRIEQKAMQLTQMDILRQYVLIQHATRVSESMRKAKMRDWTKAERKSFSYLVAMYGAPRILCKSSEDSFHSDGMYALSSSLSWMNIVRWGNLNKTAAQARAYYDQKYLLRCVEVAEMKVDPLASDQRAISLAEMVGMEYVDAYEGVLAHGLKARNLAWITLRRSQLLRDVLRVVEDRPRMLKFLESRSPELVKEMPIWWCPWVHDAALFHGIARYGVCAWEKIVLDYRLPFHLRAREAHMRRFFLEDNAVFRSVLGQSIQSEEKKMEWMRRHLVEFPSFALLEAKLHRMCDEMLKDDVEYMRLERYVEPLERREFSLATWNEAVDGFFRRFIAENDVSLEVCGVASDCAEECRESSAPAEAFGVEALGQSACDEREDSGSSSHGSMEMMVS